MTHIHGQQDADLHDEHGYHVKPEYQAPAERLPDDEARARILGPVVHGSDIEKAEAAYRRDLTRYNQHLDLHGDAL